MEATAHTEREVQPGLLACCGARRSGNPLQPGGGSSVWLPSVCCVVIVGSGHRRLMDRLEIPCRTSRPRPTAGIERHRPPCEATAERPGAGARRNGTPLPATGPEDTDKRGRRARKAPGRPFRTSGRRVRDGRGGTTADGDRAGRSGGLDVGLGAGDELVVGVEDGLAPGPVPDHSLHHQAGPGLDPGDPPSALEHQQDPAGVVGQHALEIGRSGPGLHPHGLDPAHHPDPVAPLGLADRDGARSPIAEGGPIERGPGRAPARWPARPPGPWTDRSTARHRGGCEPWPPRPVYDAIRVVWTAIRRSADTGRRWRSRGPTGPRRRRSRRPSRRGAAGASRPRTPGVARGWSTRSGRRPRFRPPSRGWPG